MLFKFTKMEGLGNDFVIIDIRGENFKFQSDQLIRIANRRIGIGCDQILLIDEADSKLADFSYKVVNADGTLADHCGNGLRCVILYLNRKNDIADRACAEIGGNLYYGDVLSENMVRVNMGNPNFVPEKVGLVGKVALDRYRFYSDGEEISYGAVSMGNPHAVVEVKSLGDTDVEKLGKKIQGGAGFQNGVNVGFCEFVNESLINLKVWERGVGETPACGTGACAAVAIGFKWGKLSSFVNVRQTGGDLLIEWDGDMAGDLKMTGPANHIFEGTIVI